MPVEAREWYLTSHTPHATGAAAGGRSPGERRPLREEAAPDHGQTGRGEGDGVLRAKAPEQPQGTRTTS